MVTFSFFIPQEVIASMGLINDGQTVSKQVRIGDLVDAGQLTMNEYHALAAAGMVFMPTPLYPFLSVEETAEGWYCQFDWFTNTKYLYLMFPGGKLSPIPGGRECQLWLPTPPPQGFFYSKMLVRTYDVVRHKGHCVVGSIRIYSFSEGEVTLSTHSDRSEWVEMDLHHINLGRCNRSYLATGGKYQISLDYLRIAY